MGKTLGDVIGYDSPSLTHRQYLVFEAWLEEEWNHPSRTDEYISQLTREVYLLRCKTPGRLKNESDIKLSLFHLRFERPKVDLRKHQFSNEQKTAITKAIWRSRLLGLKGKENDDGNRN